MKQTLLGWSCTEAKVVALEAENWLVNVRRNKQLSGGNKEMFLILQKWTSQPNIHI